jgi:hypothetical protein
MQIQFDRKDKIGEGMFGTVFRGKLNGRDVAVKRDDDFKLDFPLI